MDTRPIYHRCNETIRGHVFCSFLALLLKTELERRMKFADFKCEWAQVIRGLDSLQQVEVTFQDKRFVLRSPLTSEASAALRATGVAAPPTLRELS
jgi:transposase